MSIEYPARNKLPLTFISVRSLLAFVTFPAKKEEFLVEEENPRRLPIVVCIRVANMSITTRIEGLDGEVAELAKMLEGGWLSR